MTHNKLHASLALAAILFATSDTASAFPVTAAPASNPTVLVRGGAHGGFHGGGFHGGGGHYHGGHGGYHGGHNVYHGGHNVYRGGHNVYVGGGWRRPYAWRPGGAVAAGAAIGFLTAATAVAVASSTAPAPDLCWYYTDASQRAGFWDNCP